MRKTNIDNLIRKRPIELWSILDHRFILIFDDGVEKEVTANQIAISRYFWTFREFYGTPVTSKNIVNKPNKSCYADVCEDMYRRTYDNLVEGKDLSTYERGRIKANLDRLTFESVNHFSMEFIRNFGQHYQSTISTKDMYSLYDEEDIALIENCRPTQKDITRVTDLIWNKWTASERLKNNSILISNKVGVGKTAQTQQMCIIRGFQADTDGSVLSVPIMSNYVFGLNTVEELLVDSRAPVAANYAAGPPIKHSEYFGRRLKCETGTESMLVHEDCGSDNYLNILVQDTLEEDGIVIHRSDLETFVGFNYIDPDTNQMKKLNKGDKHLLGKKVNFRSPIGCKSGAGKICTTCMGDISRNFSLWDGPGFRASVTLSQRETQNFLSKKHQATVNETSNIRLTKQMLKFIVPDTRKLEFYMKEQDVPFKLFVPITDMRNLQNLSYLDEEDINPIFIGGVTNIFIKRPTVDEDVEGQKITLGSRNKRALATRRFLRFLKKKGWEQTEDGVLFDLTGWDYKEPIFWMKKQDQNALDDIRELEALLEGRKSSSNSRKKNLTPEKLFHKLNDFFNSKRFTHASMAATLVSSFMVENFHSYGAGKGKDKGCITDAVSMVSNRSLGPSMGFKGHTQILASPMTHFYGNKPTTPFDVLLDPNGYIQSVDKKIF